MQNVHLVTMQSFNEGSLDTRNARWKHMVAIDRIKTCKREFDNPMDIHAMKVVWGNETVGHFTREFSQLGWYLIACT